MIDIKYKPTSSRKKHIDKRNSDDHSIHENTSPGQEATLTTILRNANSAIKRQLSPSYWVKADIANVTANKKGYYNIELVEYDDKNRLLAKIRSFISAKKVKGIVGKFENETGCKLKKNISVLVKIDISISPVFGIQSNILAIDPSFTMGAAQMKKNNIIKRLRAENIYSKNRDLTIPAYIKRVAVISPQGSAAIGDFRTEADILEANGLCEFEYIPAIFQGPNAVSSLVSAFRQVSKDVDCVVFIRGGGSRSDLEYIDEYEVSFSIANCPVPVLSGVGHQEDVSIADEIACKSFDTPSKVSKYIFDSITSKRAEIERLRGLVVDKLDGYYRGVVDRIDKLSQKAKVSRLKLMSENDRNRGRLRILRGQIDAAAIRQDAKRLLSKTNRLRDNLMRMALVLFGVVVFLTGITYYFYFIN